MIAPPFIVGLDLANEPDRSAIMSWRDGVRMVHALPPGAAVVFYKDQIVVTHPNGPPYTVDPETGQTTPLVFQD